MFFSVVVPVYNVEKYLKECVDSILSQTFTDFELILVDDGSTDLSGNICDAYAAKDSRVKVIHKENGGLSDARNVGTKSANGKYVVYIDSDDYISSNDFLETVYLNAKDEPDIVCYKFKKYFEKTNEFSECKFFLPDINRYETMWERIGYLVKQDAFYCSAWTKSVRLELIKENEIYFEKGLLGEDQEWYYGLLLKAQSITGIDRDFIVYRQRENSITSSAKIKNLDDCMYLLKKWNKGIGDAQISDEYRKALYHSLAKLYCNMLILYTGLKDKNKKKHHKEIKQLAKLLKYDYNPRTKIFNKIYRLCGFEIMMLALKIICKIR
ncbi:MAG: glycosyltransferase [Ruminococcaceae bacterium]|nr:glycosyltransferase [Oscillospiraceae bacterium]